MKKFEKKYIVSMMTFTILTGAYLVLVKQGLFLVMLGIVFMLGFLRVTARFLTSRDVSTFLGIEVDILASCMATTQMVIAVVLGALPAVLITGVLAIVVGLSLPEDQYATTQ